MIHELREFCEDNNQEPPAPLREVKAHPDLTWWTAADPALENEADPAVRFDSPGHARTVFLQRVVHDLRYLLLELGHESERGSLPDLAAALELTRAWLGGAGISELSSERRPVV